MKLEWFIAAGAVPVVGLAAIGLARAIWRLVKAAGGWIFRQVRDATSEAISEVVEPTLAGIAASLTRSIEELREQNSRDHSEVARRLGEIDVTIGALDARQNNVEHRLSAVEARLAEVGPQQVHIHTDPGPRGERGPQGLTGPEGPSGP